MKFRIVKNEEGTFSVQRKGWFGWKNETVVEHTYMSNSDSSFNSIDMAKSYVRDVMTVETLKSNKHKKPVVIEAVTMDLKDE